MGKGKYVGIDASKKLIDEAKSLDNNRAHRYFVTDATKSFGLKETFNKAAIILALQNIKEPEKTIQHLGEVMEKNGEGKAAKMENRAREEFPMFMAILAVKR